MTSAADALFNGEQIDRESSTPLYLQLEQIIRRDIEEGRYEPGDLLPSESEIQDHYDVSRSVVRQTLKNLAHAGLVQTERGRGSFVAEQKLSERFVQRTTGFYDDLTRMGLDIETRVLAQRVATVPLQVREFLGVDEAVRIDRLRAVAGRVLAYVVTYLPVERCPGLLEQDLSDRSLYAHLEEVYGLKVHSGYRTVEAVPAEADAAHHLDVSPGTPLLLLRSAGRAQDGQPLEWFEAWHRADRTRFEIEILPGETRRPFQQRALINDPDPSAIAPTDSTEDFVEMLRRRRVVAVLRASTYGDGRTIASALVAGGIDLVEFTLTGSNALEAIEQASAVDDAVVGAGSVLSAQDARRAVEAGAQFLVCPARVREVVDAVNGMDVPVILAGLTPSEVLEAHRLTGGPVKLFPAGLGGPSYLRSVAAPLPGIPLIPSGGVDADNAADYLAAGAIAVNVGSSLCPVSALEAADDEVLEDRARRLRDAIDEVAT